MRVLFVFMLQTLSPQHPDVGNSYSNLAVFLMMKVTLSKEGSIMSVFLLLGNELWGLNILALQQTYDFCPW